jgi:hypothetical protein
MTADFGAPDVQFRTASADYDRTTTTGYDAPDVQFRTATADYPATADSRAAADYNEPEVQFRTPAADFRTRAVPVSAPAAPVSAPAAPAHSRVGSAVKLLIPLTLGAAVAVGLGAYGRLHDPTGVSINVAGFSSPLTVKVWLGTGSAALALVQLLSAFGMWGRLPGVRAGSRVASFLHRWSGRVAFLLAVPVAVHCLYALGFQGGSTRVLVHSLLGCLFFGAFTLKMLLLPKRGLAGWVLPVFGGLVFTVLIGVWATSSLWFFTTSGIKF